MIGIIIPDYPRLYTLVVSPATLHLHAPRQHNGSDGYHEKGLIDYSAVDMLPENDEADN